MSRERSRSPNAANRNGPSRVAESDRVNTIGRVQRPHWTHTIPDFPWNNREDFKALTSKNLKRIIIQYDIEVSDRTFDSGGKSSKITAIIQHFRNWQRRDRRGSNNNNNDNEELAPLQRPPLSQVIINSDEIDANHFSQLLQNNNHNNNNNNIEEQNIIILDENDAAFSRFIEIMSGNSNNNINDNNNELENEEKSNELVMNGGGIIRDMEDINNNNNELEIENGNNPLQNEENNNELIINGGGGIIADMADINNNNNELEMEDGNNNNELENEENNNNNDELENEEPIVVNNNEIPHEQQLNRNIDEEINIGGGDNNEEVLLNENIGGGDNNEEVLLNENIRGGDIQQPQEQELLNENIDQAIGGGGNNEEEDDMDVAVDMNIANDRINNPNLLSPEFVQMAEVLARHGLQHIHAYIVGEGVRIEHIPFVAEDDFPTLHIFSLRDRAAMRATMSEISSVPPPPPPVVPPPPPPVVPPPPPPPVIVRYPLPTNAQLADYFRKGIGSVFKIMPSTGQLPSTSGQVRHDFNNNTNNNKYRPIKHYIEPNEPINSKNYVHGTHKTTKSIMNHLNQKSFITVTQVHDPQNMAANVGGYWSCKFSIPLIVGSYNGKTAGGQEEMFLEMLNNSIEKGGYVDWWRICGARNEPVTVRSILNWDNPPVFGQQIQTQAPAIDLASDPRPFN